MPGAMIYNVPSLDHEPARIDPVGRCIYCGVSGEAVKLTDEHILPDGIGGLLILPKASCGDCQEKINKFEQPVMKSYFGMARHLKGIRARKKRKKDYQSKQRVDFVPHFRSEHESREVAKRKIPERALDGLEEIFKEGLFLEHYLARPGILAGKTRRECEQPHTMSFVVLMDPIDGKVDYEAEITLDAQLGWFEKFIAKIAHCFTVVHLGLDGFEPYLNEFIIDERPAHNRYLVGSFERDPIKPYERGVEVPPVHRVALTRADAKVFVPPNVTVSSRPVITCEIHFFAYRFAVVYEVVTGVAKDPDWLEKAGDAFERSRR